MNTKKKVLMIGLLLVLVGAALVYFFWEKQKTGIQVEDVLPAEPLLYLRLTGVEKNIVDFGKTEFFQRLKKIEFSLERALQSSGASTEKLQAYRVWRDQVFTKETLALMNLFFGKEAAVAFYPVDFKDIDLESLMKMASGIVVISRLSQQAKFVEFVARLFAKKQQDIKLRTVPYGKHTIQVLELEKEKLTLGYARIGELLVWGITEQPVRRCIDVWEKKSPAWSASDNFKKARSLRLKGAEAFGYLSFQQMGNVLKRQALNFLSKYPVNKEEIEREFNKMFATMKGVQAVNFSGVYEQQTRLKFDVLFERESLDDRLRPLYDCAPVLSRTLDFTPANVMGYQWSGCSDFKYFWEKTLKQRAEFHKSNPEQASAEEYVKDIETKLNLSVEKDILPAVGKEAGWILNGIDTSGFIPVPEIMFFVETADLEKMQKVVETIVEQQLFLKPETEEYGKILIHYVQLPFMNNVQPAYALLDKYLVVSTNQALIKKAWDTLMGQGVSMASREDLRQLKIGIDEKSNFIFYLELRDLMERAEKLVEWGSQWMVQSSSKQEAFLSGSEKRLEDIQKKIVEDKEELEALKVKYNLFEEEHKEVKGDVGELDQLIQERGQFIESLKSVMVKAKDEQRSILALRTAEIPELSPEAQARLEELDEAINKRNEKMASLSSELIALAEQRDVLLRVIGERRDMLALLSEKEKALQLDQGAAQEVLAIIQEYKNSEKVPLASQAVILDGLIKPLMQALASIKYIVSRTVIYSGTLESSVLWEFR